MRTILVAILAFLVIMPACLAQEPSAGQVAASTSAPPADPFDFGDRARAGSSDQQYLELDENIKLKVEPLVHSAVVDRVMDPATTVYVSAPGFSFVEVFIEPVDSPFCGKSLAEPRLLGSSKDSRRSFPITWNSAENYRYVKLYAVAHKSGGSGNSRSRSLDLSMAGTRYEAGR